MIQVVDLVKRYRKATRNAVDGISFEVGAGEFFALLGPNGAGKTTTISILTTTLLPTSGNATIAGHDLVAEASAVRGLVGIIFQRPSLDQNLTGEENIRLHAILYGIHPYAPAYRLMEAGYRRRVGELAELLGIGKEVFDPVRTYSGGMRRKLEIVRSLMHQPKVLFLDEPTAGLDPPSRRTLWSYLDTVRQEHQTTIFLTTHYIEEAEQADKVCFIDGGHVVASGTPADLKAALVDEYIVVDAENRAALDAELTRHGHRPLGWRSVQAPARGAPNARGPARDHDAADPDPNPCPDARGRVPRDRRQARCGARRCMSSPRSSRSPTGTSSS